MTPIDSSTTTGPVPLHPDSCVPLLNDPPPPYPSRERRTRTTRSNRRHGSQRITTTTPQTQRSSTDSHSDYEARISPQALLSPHIFPTQENSGDAEPTENTPFLGPSSPRSSTRRLLGRQRSLSHSSTIFSSTSTAPSIAQTVFSLFLTEGDSDADNVVDETLLSPEQRINRECLPDAHRRRFNVSRRALKRYFQPLWQRAYYMPLFHLVVLNFPFALVAWVYLFIFTVTGTTLLMALPLGAVLCFFNLLGARAFARGELALQATFHSPLVHLPYPPRPIFARLREPTSSEVEAGIASPEALLPETSFYKSAYAMFTDSTSYQALFYFLVIKPSITLLFSIALVLVIPVSFALVLPAPAVLRAVRKLGIWQANVAVEGLYLAVR